MKRSVMFVALAAVVVLAGCTTRFPYYASFDRHNYISTPRQPLSLTLVDTLTGETLWHLDVPPGKMAVVDFEHKTDWVASQSPALPAEKITWDIVDPGDVIGWLEHEQKLSGNPVLLKVAVLESALKPVPVTAPEPGVAPAGPPPGPVIVQPEPDLRGETPKPAVAPTPVPKPVTQPPQPAPAPAQPQPLPPLDIPDAGAPAPAIEGPKPQAPASGLDADDNAR
jgi:hypothetical protein